MKALIHFFRHFSLYFAWLITLIATFMSLYISEIHGIEPCSLCWYQRICLFPLVIILGYATYRHYASIMHFVIALPIIGFFIASYHLFITIFSSHHKGSCLGQNPCIQKIDLLYSNPIVMPLLSLIAFFLITCLLFLASRKSIHSSSDATF